LDEKIVEEMGGACAAMGKIKCTKNAGRKYEGKDFLN
jgi:hypothetical protein